MAFPLNQKISPKFYLVTVLSSLLCSATFANNLSDPNEISLGKIVVSARRFPQNSNHVSENVEVLTEKDINTLPASDLGEVLRTVPGLDVTSRTGLGHFVPLSIQGSVSPHVLVMVDGIPFNTQASGQADILPILPMHNLERIEVIKGAASSSWDASLGGVVNLITKNPSESSVPEGHWTSSVANWDTQAHHGDLSGKIGKVGYYFSMEHQDSDGIKRQSSLPNKEDTLHNKMFGKWTYPLTDLWQMMMSLGYSGADINEGPYFSDNSRTHVPYAARYGLWRLESNQEEPYYFEAAFKWNRQRFETQTFDGLANTPSSVTQVRNYYYGSELKAVLNLRDQDRWVLGYDISDSNLKSNQMDRARDVLVQAPYTSYILSWQGLDFLGGLRYDFNEEFGEQLNPNAGLVLHCADFWSTEFRVNITRAFNAPPLLWKYFENVVPGTTANNPNILPERAWVYEAGVQTHPEENLFFKFNVYQSNITDAIGNASNVDGLIIKSNFQKFVQQGIGFESKAQLLKGCFLSLATNLNYVEDKRLNRQVKNRGVTSPSILGNIFYQNNYGFEAGLSGRFQRWDSSTSAQPHDRKAIFDGRVSKKFKNISHGIDWVGYINIYNLLDSEYWSDFNFPLPPRTIEVGSTFEF